MDAVNTWMHEKFLGVELWSWSALAIYIFVSLVARPALEKLILKLKKLIARPSERQSFWSYWRELKTERPLSFVLWFVLSLAFIESLALPPGAEKYLALLIKILLSFYLIQAIYISIDALGRVFRDWASKTPGVLDDQLAPFATKTLKLLVVVLGALTTLQNLNVNVVSLLAGLGLGGLALALAAQDTAANLFGSITILFDNPFKLGDTVKIGDTEGTVEEIGFRSTRIRTGYNSLVTIPNATVAKEKIDNLGVRPFRRCRQILGLHYDTPPELIERFCHEVRYLILQDKSVHRDSVSVNFVNYNASTLDILMVFHLEVFQLQEEYDHQQKIFCEILQLAKKMGVIFAYPTQSVYLQNQLPESNPAL